MAPQPQHITAGAPIAAGQTLRALKAAASKVRVYPDDPGLRYPESDPTESRRGKPYPGKAVGYTLSRDYREDEVVDPDHIVKPGA